MSNTQHEYDIREEGNRVALIKADSPEQALQIAATEYPRRRCDYNMGPDDEPYELEWRAFNTADDDDRASLKVTIPSTL